MDKSDPLRQLMLATVLLTRLPLPHLSQATFNQGARAVWAYPVVGLMIGALGALAGGTAVALGCPAGAAAAVAFGAMTLATGAMHEDGLADLFDGFWGGFTPERRLAIMRDSQIGTYGVLALVLFTFVQISAIAHLLEVCWPALVVAATVSRTTMAVLMRALPQARADGLSHSVGRPQRAPVAVSCVIGTATALVLLGAAGLVAVALTTVLGVAVALLARAKIGGQTGDVLGATQQITNTGVLLFCAAWF